MFYITITNIIAVITTVATYRSYDMTYYLSLVHGGRAGGRINWSTDYVPNYFHHSHHPIRYLWGISTQTTTSAR